MPSYKFAAPPGGFNYNKLINELAVALGQVPQAALASNGAVEVLDPSPLGLNEALITGIVQGHRPNDIVQTGAFLFGNADTQVGSSGIAANVGTSNFGLSASGAAGFASNIGSMDIRGLTFTDNFNALMLTQVGFKGTEYRTIFGMDNGVPRWAIYGAPNSGEMLVNGDFETGDFTNWTPSPSGTSSILIDTETVYEGDYAAKLTVPNGSAGLTLTSGRIDLDPYWFNTGELTGYALQNTSGSSPVITVYLYDDVSAGSVVGGASVYTAWVADTWQYLFEVFEIPTTAKSAEITVTISGTATYDRVLWLDGISLQLNNTTSYQEVLLYPTGLLLNNLSIGSYNLLSLDSSDRLTYRNKYLQTGYPHYGDYVGYSQVVAGSVTPTTAYTRTIKANSMGTNGFFTYEAWFLVSNTGATSVGCTIDATFGGTTLYSQGTNATGTSTPRYLVAHIWGVVTNKNDASAQLCETIRYDSPTSSDSTTVAVGSVASAIKTAAINTASADRDFTLVCTLSTATNSKVERLRVKMDGPFYA